MVKEGDHTHKETDREPYAFLERSITFCGHFSAPFVRERVRAHQVQRACLVNQYVLMDLLGTLGLILTLLFLSNAVNYWWLRRHS